MIVNVWWFYGTTHRAKFTAGTQRRRKKIKDTMSVLSPQYCSYKPVNYHWSPYLSLTNLIIKAAYSLMCQICLRKSPLVNKKGSLPQKTGCLLYECRGILYNVQFILADMKNRKWSTKPAALIARTETAVLNMRRRLAPLKSPSVEGPYRQSRLTLTGARNLTPCGNWRLFSWDWKF